MTLQMVSGSTGKYTSTHLDKKNNLLKANEHFTRAKIMLEACNQYFLWTLYGKINARSL